MPSVVPCSFNLLPNIPCAPPSPPPFGRTAAGCIHVGLASPAHLPSQRPVSTESADAQREGASQRLEHVRPLRATLESTVFFRVLTMAHPQPAVPILHLRSGGATAGLGCTRSLHVQCLRPQGVEMLGTDHLSSLDSVVDPPHRTPEMINQVPAKCTARMRVGKPDSAWRALHPYRKG
ncbi:hypothetical protein FB451DRAFT_1391986 [Mycena latifolia]|nr:hypothetical protein FB451DRAFT_1391986 [Mycena latifolia]